MRPVGVLWDVGNVIVRWDPRRLYIQIFPDPAVCDRFLSEVCTLDWHARTDAGLSFSDNIADLTRLYPEHAQAIAAWRDRWWEMFGGPIPETEAAIEALHARGVPQFGLTNMSAEVSAAVFAMSPAFARLADIVVSGVEGVIKPDPILYHIACARTGLAPQQMLFIDDSAANIEAARALGFDVHHFVDPADLAPALAARGWA